ncbi:MAG: hypothetical protein JW798_10455 [Prolixibacteraceae bacterium]|nr:hypothetical protein [Prolixibacteraceae bacterium]
MNDIVLKYNQLNKSARREVNDFMDFLLNRQKTNNHNFLSTYKEKIRTVSVWTEDDCKIFETNQKTFNQWKVQEW